MKKFKSLVAILLAGAMVFGLAACGETETTTSASTDTTVSSTSTDTAKTDADPVVASDEKVKLTMWCIATEGDSNRGAYEHAIADMKEKYPNVEFEWEAIENETYKTKIAAAMAA